MENKLSEIINSREQSYFTVKDDFVYGNMKNNTHLATINRVYKKIMSMLPDGLEQFDVWFGGGCYTRLLSNEKLSDIDFFSSNRGELAALTRHLRNNGYKIHFINKNAIKGYIETKRYGIVNIDIVKRTFADEITTIKNFDFSVTKIVTSTTDNVFYYINSFMDITQKRLVLPHDVHYPISTLKRLQKYIKRGFVACDGTLITLIKAIQKIDLNDPEQNAIEFYPDGSGAIPLWD